MLFEKYGPKIAFALCGPVAEYGGLVSGISFTDTDGRARFREETLALDEGTPLSRLSALMGSGGYQLRESPPGFRSQFHCTPAPQWVDAYGR